MNHLLEADSIRLAFNSKTILSDIYIKCETGNITGLLGGNGQGKSSLMKIIYGSMQSEKSVRIDRQRQVQLFKRPDFLRYLPQFNFIPKSISLHRIFKDYQLDYTVFEKRFPEFVSGSKRSVGNLSGGERRLVEIYLIVMCPSFFAMLDEPFTHLNPIQIEKVKQLLLEVKHEKGLIITDQMFRHIIDISDRLYILKDGKIHVTKDITDIETLGYAKL